MLIHGSNPIDDISGYSRGSDHILLRLKQGQSVLDLVYMNNMDQLYAALLSHIKWYLCRLECPDNYKRSLHIVKRPLCHLA